QLRELASLTDLEHGNLLGARTDRIQVLAIPGHVQVLRIRARGTAAGSGRQQAQLTISLNGEGTDGVTHEIGDIERLAIGRDRRPAGRLLVIAISVAQLLNTAGLLVHVEDCDGAAAEVGDKDAITGRRPREADNA